MRGLFLCIRKGYPKIIYNYLAIPHNNLPLYLHPRIIYITEKIQKVYKSLHIFSLNLNNKYRRNKE